MAPAAGTHGVPQAAAVVQIGGQAVADAAAVDWAAARAQALDPARITEMYTAYVATK